MARTVAVSVENGFIKLAALDGSRKRRALVAACIAPMRREEPVAVAPPAGETAAPFAGDVLESKRIPKKNAVLVLDSAGLVIRKITLPLKNPAQIRRTIKFQAERHALGATPAELYADFIITRREEAYTELILAAAKKRDVERDIAALAAIGIEVGAVTTDFAARFNALSAGRAFDDADSSVAAAFDGNSVQMLAVKLGRLVHVRNIAYPKHEHPGVLAEMLAKEIDLTWVSAGLEGKCAKIILTGDQSIAPSPEELERIAGCRVAVFKPREALDLPGDESDSGLSRFDAHIGAAIAALGAEAAEMDLLRGEREARSGYELIRKPLIIACLAFLAFLGFELLAAMESSSSANEYLGLLKKDARYWYDAALKGKKPRFSTATFAKEIKNRAASGAAAGGGDGALGGFLDFTNSISELLNGNGNTIIHTVNFKGKGASIRGEADDVDSFEKLAKSIEDSGRFEVRTQFRMRGARKGGPRKAVSFTIDIKPKGA
jgi:hypothetical protein